jgi:peptide/nickel transport system substrate-binding protein
MAGRGGADTGSRTHRAKLPDHEGLRRRDLLTSLLAVSGLIGVGTAEAAPASLGEAPMLSSLVSAGKLAPVHERLPATPLVVTPTERVGRYGGSWRTALLGSSDANWILWSIGYASLVRWTPDWSGITPDVARAVEVSEDGRTYVFRLREGMRWSDGHAFTSHDVMFWYEDVLLDKRLSPTVPRWLTAAGKPVQVEAPDPATVVFTFAQPNGMFLSNLCVLNTTGALGQDILSNSPRHYLEQFHGRYNSRADEQAHAAGFSSWTELYQSKVSHPSRWRNTDLPVLTPWMISEPYSGGTRVTARRNPYFYKVDTAGNQLPYLDEVTYSVVEDLQVMVLRAIQGDLDLHYNGLNTSNVRQILFDHRVSGGYRFFATQPAWSNTMLININQTHRDPVKRAVFDNKDFRIGLSYAMNRMEIIEAIYFRQGEPWQAAPRPNTRLYDERFAKQYTEYDSARANLHLDRAGLSRRDNDGWRLMPDGRRLEIIFEVCDFYSTHVDTMPFLQRHWTDVGVYMQYRSVTRTLLYTHLTSNNFDATTWIGGGGLDQLTLNDPKWYFPQAIDSSYAPAWAQWYMSPSRPAAEKPPPEVLHDIELYRQVTMTPDPTRQDELMRQILESAANQFRVIGTSLEPDRYGIVRNEFRNAPASIPMTFLYSGIGPANPEQFFHAEDTA